MKPINMIVIGAGSRGNVYASYAKKFPEQLRIVGVAEPREFYRNKMANDFDIPGENVYSDWMDIAARDKFADAVIVATTDRLHTQPAILAAKQGYHLLLEKPMAPTLSECIEIVKAVQKNNIIFAVCHVLRYAPFFKNIKNIIESGKLGEICSIQHMEGVGWWHFPHSFVRGNFGNEEKSSFLLLAKCCHDIDVLRWWVDKPCVKVSSFGHLKHFRRENRPSNSADRCMDCLLADDKCPYSAKKFYFERLRQGRHGWPLNMVINEMTENALCKALKEGPYGKCVYLCDNDVVDSQTVNMDFENNISINMVVSAFTPIGRKVRIMGTKGYLEGDEETIRILDFLSEEWSEHQVNTLALDITGGHGGGDHGMMTAFLDAVRGNNKSLITTGPEISLESHLIVFAAEESRLENRVVTLTEIHNSSGV